jgi:hypothetical protein
LTSEESTLTVPATSSTKSWRTSKRLPLEPDVCPCDERPDEDDERSDAWDERFDPRDDECPDVCDERPSSKLTR